MKLKDWLILIVLLCAGMHCVQCIFNDNTSLLNLQDYENGQEMMPFQGRVGMMPVLRWAHTHYAALAAVRGTNAEWGQEEYSPEKLVSYKVGLLSVFAIVLMCARYGRRVRPDLWWVCPGLAVAAFYITYAARADQPLWYPYDLPHAALFTGACLALLEGRWFWMAAFFLADTPMRETSVFLLPCLLAVGWVERKRARAGAYAGLLAAVWLIVHALIAHRFRANVTDVGIHHHAIYEATHHPHYWPQTASIFGFLWLPLALGWQWLSSSERAFVFGALPGVLVSIVFGIWFETRVWLEWNAVAACFCVSIFTRYLSSRTTGASPALEAERSPALEAAL